MHNIFLTLLNQNLGGYNIKNIYVGDDGKLHTIDKAGADSALPFSKMSVMLNKQILVFLSASGNPNSYYPTMGLSKLKLYCDYYPYAISIYTDKDVLIDTIVNPQTKTIDVSNTDYIRLYIPANTNRVIITPLE